MPKIPRCALPDGAFHVMSHAVDGGLLFRRDADRKMYLGLLQITAERYGWTVITFVLMDNHVHLVVVSTTKQLSEGLWWLNRKYAGHYKEMYGPHLGHVFSGRPKTKPIRTEAYLLAVVRYIALNPVGVMCDRPEEYRWSAHRAIVGESPALPLLAVDEVLGRFGPDDAIARYTTFVTGRDPDDHRAVRDWAAGPPPGRPDLSDLIADRTDASLLVAHDTWEYSIRAISRVVGRSRTAVRAAIVRARRDVSAR